MAAFPPQGTGVAAVAPDFPRILGPAAHRMLPGWYAHATTTRAVAAGMIYYIPIFVPETMEFAEIRIEVTVAGAVGTVADMRIFSERGWLPHSLILDAGTVSTDVIGFRSIAIWPPVAFTRGYYFVAYRCTGTPTLRVLDPERAVMPPCPGMSLDGAISPRSVVFGVLGAYADPAPFPNEGFGADFVAVQLQHFGGI